MITRVVVTTQLVISRSAHFRRGCLRPLTRRSFGGLGEREKKRKSIERSIFREAAFVRSLFRGSVGLWIIESRWKNRASHRGTKVDRKRKRERDRDRKRERKGERESGVGGIIKIDSTEVAVGRSTGRRGLAAAGREIAANSRRLIGGLIHHLPVFQRFHRSAST